MMSPPESNPSTSIACRLLPHERGDGPANMALDEALLDLVAEHPGQAIVRTYEWSVPTLSLGYFQSIQSVATDPRWAGHAVVRRPTGGGALWHDHELTYAVVVPAHHPLARPSTALYQAVHDAIAAELRNHGIPAARRGLTPAPVGGIQSRPFLCFLDKDADDVVVGPVKLVGSAQRRRSGAVLQHGSLLLEGSVTTPEIVGLHELESAGPQREWQPTKVREWTSLLRRILTNTLGGLVIAEDLADHERKSADSLRKDIYESPGWTNRR